MYKAWCGGAWKLFDQISNHVNYLKKHEAVSSGGSLQLIVPANIYISFFLFIYFFKKFDLPKL